MSAYPMFPLRPEACDCKGDYDGEHSVCQMCGTANLEGRATLTEAYILDGPRDQYGHEETERAEVGWTARLDRTKASGPTREVALAALREVRAAKKAWVPLSERERLRGVRLDQGALDELKRRAAEPSRFPTSYDVTHATQAKTTQNTLPAEEACGGCAGVFRGDEPKFLTPGINAALCQVCYEDRVRGAWVTAPGD